MRPQRGGDGSFMEAVRKWAGWIAVLVLASMVLLEVPRGAVLLAVAAAAGGLYWLLRSSKASKPAQMQAEQAPRPRSLDRGIDLPDPDVLARRPLHKLEDVRLAAVILMIQLVRTGAPLTASEKNVIFDLMADPLEIEDRQAMYELAWRMTDRGRVFSPVADDLAPLLMDRLTLAERLDFIEMLSKVASAYGEASDLQREAIVRLKRRLTGSQAPSLRIQ
jgi:uncharacterized tellurite resistance protein B-like protein